jgi:Ca2+-binding RTX toxin-like protein
VNKQYLHTEVLESRRLLAASIVNNTLVVTGTAASDQINIQVAGDFVRVDINERASSFDATRFDGVSVSGGAGSDVITYVESGSTGRAAPTVHGNAGNDRISIDRQAEDDSSGGQAFYFGDAGNDTFTFGSSLADRSFRGGPGIDTVDYAGFTTDEGISASIDGVANDGPLGSDNVGTDVEVIRGTAGDDTLIGDASNETLFGGAGDDSIVGNGGADLLAGGSGTDSLVGNSNDTLQQDGDVLVTPSSQLNDPTLPPLFPIDTTTPTVPALTPTPVTGTTTPPDGTVSRTPLTRVPTTSTRLSSRQFRPVGTTSEGTDGRTVIMRPSPVPQTPSRIRVLPEWFMR